MSDAKTPDAPPPAEPVDRARRRLLGMAKYVPPVIVGIISLQQAGCQPAPSCGPSVNPCGPNGNPCGPDQPCVPDQPCMPDNCNPNNVGGDPGTQGPGPAGPASSS